MTPEKDAPVAPKPNPDAGKPSSPRRLVRFIFPRGTGPREMARAIHELTLKQTRRT